ncbi:MAG: hypothetical protein ACP5UD_09370 [Conexivisphaera sp.]
MPRDKASVSRPTYPDISEEEASDRDLASEGIPSRRYLVLFDDDPELSRAMEDCSFSGPPEKSIFIDGTLSTVRVRDIQCGGYIFPLFVSNIVVGALERIKGALRPLDKIILYVLLIPDNLLLTKCGIPSLVPDNVPRLDWHGVGEFYKTIVKHGSSSLIFSDTARRMDGKQKLEAMPIPGIMRRYATDRAKVLMRTTELAMLYKLHERGLSKDHIIFMDGPIGLLMPYFGLLGLPSSDDKVFDLYRNVIGLVKNVIMVPYDIMTVKSDEFKLYFFTEIAGLENKKLENKKEDEEELERKRDHVRDNVFSWYYRLRLPLLGQFTDIWSSASAFIRADIFASFLLGEEYRGSWPSKLGSQDKNEVKRMIESDQYARQRLRDLICYVKAEAYPVPPTYEMHRMLVESYGIYETERYIKSSLLRPVELVARFG